MTQAPIYSEYDTFELAKELPDRSVPLGTQGVILMVLGGDPVAYEVEFPDEVGGNLGNSTTYTLTEDFFRKDS
jgi:hypothetical protein